MRRSIGMATAPEGSLRYRPRKISITWLRVSWLMPLAGLTITARLAAPAVRMQIRAVTRGNATACLMTDQNTKSSGRALARRAAMQWNVRQQQSQFGVSELRHGIVPCWAPVQ